MFSLIIPVFNEAEIIERTVREAHDVLQNTGPFEVIVINDGSTDQTGEILARLHLPYLRIINHPYNKGYGASMKTGIRHSQGQLIGTVDADGTYPIREFPTLIQKLNATHADMIVGARVKKGVQIPLARRPAKWLVNLLANILTGIKIPDLNSGMRVFTRELGERFMHLYPQKFSFTITITLAALTSDYIVIYHPIDYFKRIGKSTLSSGINGIRNFANFLGLIIRIVTYFRPLKFFAWPSAVLMIFGLTTIGYTLATISNISDAGLLLLLTGIQVGFFGLLADVVVRNKNK
ncbi:glycosyltransferase family 2 protein [Candidatus Peregrinibacteria bacterium]|nr:glycosyltransferase family 2 protein [Candidatus Peregrinibacteria bacterium]